jgi:hypothetical protein
MQIDAPPEFASNKTTANIIAALEEVIVDTKSRIRRPYHFRFPSQIQAKPFEESFQKWVSGGMKGSLPVDNPLYFRTAVYNQSTTASMLAAFYRSASVIAIEFAESSLDGFRQGQLTVPCAALRSLIERIAHAVALSHATRGMPSAPIPPETPLKTVLELSQIIARALYGTQQNWTKLTQVDFRVTSHKDVAYITAAEVGGIKATNILSSIDKLEKEIPGARLTYEVLCEFLHPNRGDLYGATVDALSLTDQYGMRHVRRTIGLGPKNLENLLEVGVVVEKMLDVSADIVRHLPIVLNEIEIISTFATNITQSFAHKYVKNNRNMFRNRDFCPCLSGKAVKDCT